MFKNEPVDVCKQTLINNGYSIHSVDTIVSAAKQLFTNKQNIEALRNIIASSKVDEATRKESLQLLHL